MIESQINDIIALKKDKFQFNSFKYLFVQPTERMDEISKPEDGRMLHFSKLLRIFTKNLETDDRKNADLLTAKDSVQPIKSNGVADHHVLNGGGNHMNGETNHPYGEDDRVTNGTDADSIVEVHKETKQEKAKSVTERSLSVVGNILGSNNFMIIKRSTYQESRANLTSAVLGIEDR